MIVITYTPPEGDEQKWEIDTDSWTYGETVEIERQYGGTRKDFFEDARLGSDTARRILLWVVRRRNEPDLQLDDLDDLLVAYLGFWQLKPEADPKADAAPEAAADETPAPGLREQVEPFLLDLTREYGFHPRDLDTLTLRELAMYIAGLPDESDASDLNGGDDDGR